MDINSGECQVCHPYFKKSEQNVCIDLKCFRYNPNTGFCEECVPGFVKDEIVGACVDKEC